MRGSSTTVGDHGGRPLHHRHPVGVGGVGHQDRPIGKSVALVGRVESTHDPRGGAGADRQALEQHRPVTGDVVRRQGGTAAAGLHRLGPGLHDEQIAGHAVLRPLDVHRTPVVVLDDDRPPCQGQQVGVVEHQPISLVLGGVDRRRGTGLVVVAADSVVIDDLETLAPERPLDDGGRRLVVEERLEHPIAVGVDHARHDGLAQPPGGVDQHVVGKAALRVDGEDHPGRTGVGPDHLLDADRQCDVQVIEAVLGPVGDRPVAEQRDDAAVVRRDHRIGAAHVEEALLLPGEAGLGQVLRRGRRTDGDRHVEFADPATQIVIGGPNVALECLAHAGGSKCGTYGGADRPERLGMIGHPGTDR